MVLTCVVVFLFFKIRQPDLKSFSFGGKIIGSVLTNHLVKIETVDSNIRTRRIETLGFLAGTGPMLISEESESGIITNVYQFPSGKLITEVVLPNPKTPLLGSAEYEMLAEQDYIKSAAVETNLLEIKEKTFSQIGEKQNIDKEILQKRKCNNIQISSPSFI